MQRHLIGGEGVCSLVCYSSCARVCLVIYEKDGKAGTRLGKAVGGDLDGGNDLKMN